MSTTPPKRTAATAPTTASVSIALTVGAALQPTTTTTAVRPMHSATAAAKRMRLEEGTRGPASAPHRAGDDHALDLVGALVDLRDLGVAHHPLDRVVVDVPVAAEDLHGVDGHRHRRVRREE